MRWITTLINEFGRDWRSCSFPVILLKELPLACRHLTRAQISQYLQSEPGRLQGRLCLIGRSVHSMRGYYGDRGRLVQIARLI